MVSEWSLASCLLCLSERVFQGWGSHVQTVYVLPPSPSRGIMMTRRDQLEWYRLADLLEL